MLCTVSTVKDTRANVETFVSRNLSSGADHMFVFLEGDEDGTHQLLRDHPHVTPVLTDEDYWSGNRPDELIRRQIVNANLVNCLVSPVGSVEWLVHLDGDECLEIDKEQLVALGPEVRCVRLAVLEAVSTEHGSRDVEYFKKKLRPDQLETLVQLGVLEEPQNRQYLRGHLLGKAAVRPGLDLDMGIHRAARKGGDGIEHLKAPGFRVLHYDAVSADEFVRKWVSHIRGGSTVFREERTAILQAVRAVLAASHSDKEREQEELRTIYRQHVEDPVDLLREQGLLVRPRPTRHAYRPTPFSDRDRKDVEQLLALLLRVDKRLFRGKGPSTASVDVMRQVRGALGLRGRRLAHRVDAAVERAVAELAR